MIRRLKRLFRPRLVAVSVARDEEDVVEAFVRHTAELVDHHLIVDHCSHDRTPEILRGLVQVGVSLSVFRCDDPVYNQPPLTNLLMDRAVSEFDADWVVPLDADEFIIPANPAAGDAEDCLHQSIATSNTKPGCLIYPFRTFHPTKADDASEVNVVRRLGYHYGRETGEYHKVVVSSSLVTKGAQLMPGNHHVNVDGTLVEPAVMEGLVLGHYPVRSLGQFVRKIATAELGKDSFGKKRKGLGTQKTEPFELLKSDPHRFFEEALQPDRPLRPGRGIYLGDELLFTELEDEPAATVRSLLCTSHELARQLGEMRDSQREKGVNPLEDQSGIELKTIEVAPKPDAPRAVEVTNRRAPVADPDEVLPS